MILYIFVLYFLTAVIGNVSGDMFTSMATLEPLANAENVASHRIEEYIAMEMDRIDHLRRLAMGYRKEFLAGKKTAGAAKEMAQNPLNLFRTRKRLTVDFDSLLEQMRDSENSQSFLENITLLPTRDDFKGARDALFRLQDVYRLTATDMANGKIQGSAIVEKLTAHDAFELGRQASLSDDDYHAILWLEEALSRVRQESKPTVDEADVLDYLQYSLAQQGNVLLAYKATKRLVNLRPMDEKAQDNLKWYTEDLKKAGLKATDSSPKLINQRPKHYDEKERDVFESLCRGETHLAESEIRKLYCYYKSDRQFLKYAPIKVEILHFKPFVAIFRQVLSAREGDIIKKLATPKLQRATVLNRFTRELEHASYRITKSAWLKSEDHEAIHQINLRLEDMTNLDQSTAEMFQVANYGLGGHYDPHFDHSDKADPDPFKDGNGNRISTVLFYLNVPTAGGATVFLNEKLAVFPQKNDALFWYNLRPSGEGDRRTRHAACPVLAGMKWVSNKWIHERNQEFRRPCKLHFNAEDYKIDFYQ